MSISLILICLLHISIVLAQIELGDIALGCPAASYRHGDYCYSQSVVVSTNFHDAQVACATFGGSLALIRDEETLQFLRRLSIRKYLLDYWIGLTDHEEEGMWVFSDGSLLQSFNRWYPGEPNNHAKIEHCAYLWMLRGLNWNDDSCDKKHNYACQFDASHCPESGNVFRRGQFCFLLSMERVTFSQASGACRAMGGTLVMDKDESTHEALTAAIYEDRSWLDLSDENVSSLLAVSDGATWMRSWIGVTRSSSGRWQYLDGSVVPLESMFWGPGEPGSMQCASSSRHWYTNNCRAERGFICQYAVDLSAQLSSTDKFSSSKSNDSGVGPVVGTVSNRVLKVLKNRAILGKGKIYPTAASSRIKETKAGISLGQAVFVILLLCCFIFGGVCTAAVLKRQALKRQIQSLGKKRGNKDDTSVTFTTLENSDVA